MAEQVLFKGVKDGLELRLDGECPFENLKKTLEAKLISSSHFFNAGMEVTVICEARELEVFEIIELQDILESYGLVLGPVLREIPASHQPIVPTPPKRVASQPVQSQRTPAPSRGSDEDGYEGSVLVFKRSLRSGQKISYPGMVIVMGDVNPGAEIVAGADILILGTCRGLLHAGAPDNIYASITATRLMAPQIRIAELIARSPDSREEPNGTEQARIIDGHIVIEKA